MSDTTSFVSELDPISKLTRDLRDAARTLSTDEARFLVDAYYAMQRDRIRAGHQERTLSAGNEPHDVMSWLMDQRESLEGQVRRALDAYSGAHAAGIWARSITGIGPVIAAGLLANIDIHESPTVGHIWRFAGLDPTNKWEKSTKRPWNGSLKRLCWLIGESFVKVSANESDVYGQVYKSRKELEIARNEAGAFAEQAAASLAAKKFGKDTEARKHYEAGKLPPARIHLRSERYAVKLFLSHLHCVWYFQEFGQLPPKPYILTQEGHVHFIGPPNAHLVPGLEAALKTMDLAPGRRWDTATEPSASRAPRGVSEPNKGRAPKRASEPVVGRAPKQTSEPSKGRAPGGVSEPSAKRAPSHESEPIKGRAPIRQSEPSGRRAPMKLSEPTRARAPNQTSEPRGRRAPTKLSEPREERAPMKASEPRASRAPKAKSEPSKARAPTRQSEPPAQRGRGRPRKIQP